MSISSELKDLYRSLVPDQPLGLRGEKAAARYLRRHGMRIIEHSYSNHIGEIDLIAVEDKKTVVFVEVKTRQNDDKGLPVEAVNQQKQDQIVQTALVYLRHHRLLESPYRFDIVSVMWPETSRRPEIEHFVSAFEPSDNFQMFS